MVDTRGPVNAQILLPPGLYAFPKASFFAKRNLYKKFVRLAASGGPFLVVDNKYGQLKQVTDLLRMKRIDAALFYKYDLFCNSDWDCFIEELSQSAICILDSKHPDWVSEYFSGRVNIDEGLSCIRVWSSDGGVGVW